jgi:capsular polysaccharide biosynthesis protein
VIEPAVKPYKPVKPNRPLYVAISILLGVVVSFGFTLFVESFDHSLNTAEDARNALGLPILASISEIGPPNRSRHMISDGESWGDNESWSSEHKRWP